MAAAIAVLVVAFWGAGSEVRAVEGGSISGTVYFDTDMDGQRDAGEPPATGRRIELRQYLDEPPYEILVDTGLTDGRGAYTLDGIVPGARYWVSIHADRETPCRNKDGFTYPPEEGEIFDADFGVLERGTGSISGSVIDDRDEDGVRDVGEPGSEGWGMYLVLRSYNGPMYCDFYDVSDYSGRYGFTGLPLLTYEVEYWPEYNMPPWEITSPVEREDRASATHYPLVDLRDKAQASGVDILAHFISGTSTIEGIAFRDLNLNTVRDEGEEILNCAVYSNTINIYRETPAGRLTLNEAEVTCDNAEFALSGISDGSYAVEFGTWCTGPNAGEASWLPGPVRSVAITGGRQAQPLEMNMCPQAAAWYPIPEPTPSATATPTLIMPDVGTGTADPGNTLSDAVMPATTLIAIVAIIGTMFVLRRRFQRAG
jgi:hypothetical protein